jgi:DNA repair and recombination protein RAD52
VSWSRRQSSRSLTHNINRPGDQYGNIPNPFSEPPTRISEYTALQIATLQSRLDKFLGPEYIAHRPGAGGKRYHYIPSEKVIGLANEVFGFNGWSSSIQNVQIDYVC